MNVWGALAGIVCSLQPHFRHHSSLNSCFYYFPSQKCFDQSLLMDIQHLPVVPTYEGPRFMRSRKLATYRATTSSHGRVTKAFVTSMLRLSPHQNVSTSMTIRGKITRISSHENTTPWPSSCCLQEHSPTLSCERLTSGIPIKCSA